MAEGLKEVIAKLKAQQQNSQNSKPAEKPVKKVEVQEEKYPDEDTEEFLEDETDETPKEQEKSTEKLDPAQKTAMEIELLQNNGRYRVEFLHQMQEINRNLVGIAEILVDVAGNVKANK
jgi:hypothetical protein